MAEMLSSLTSEEAFEDILAIWKQAGLTLKGTRPCVVSATPNSDAGLQVDGIL